jgi:hypothetical protein
MHKPLNLQEIADARKLATSVADRHLEDHEARFVVSVLAGYLLRALAQIEALTKQADPFCQGRRFYPELDREGLAHLWRGPGRNDFAEPLVLATQKHLRKRDLPAERGDAINAIRNKILSRDWGWLEQRWQEGESRQKGQGSRGPMNRAADPGAAPLPNSPEYFRWLEERRGG